jgi:hypothetical protein
VVRAVGNDDPVEHVAVVVGDLEVVDDDVTATGRHGADA